MTILLLDKIYISRRIVSDVLKYVYAPRAIVLLHYNSFVLSRCWLFGLVLIISDGTVDNDIVRLCRPNGIYVTEIKKDVYVAVHYNDRV
jgi:hypothetical protein